MKTMRAFYDDRPSPRGLHGNGGGGVNIFSFARYTGGKEPGMGVYTMPVNPIGRTRGESAASNIGHIRRLTITTLRQGSSHPTGVQLPSMTTTARQLAEGRTIALRAVGVA